MTVTGKARLCPNGFGDRMVALVAYTTWHNLRTTGTLLLFWPQNERHGLAFEPVNHLDVIRRFFEIAADVRITTDVALFEAASVFDYTTPYPQRLWPPQLSLVSGIDRGVLRTKMFEYFKIIKPGPLLCGILPQIGDTIGVHIRRGDKVGKESNLKLAIKREELSKLDSDTYTTINKTSGSLFMCGDGDSGNFKRIYAARLINAPHLDLPYADVFLDFFMLQRCSRVIISNRYSNFSIVAALSGGVEFSIVMPDEKFLESRDLHLLRNFVREKEDSVKCRDVLRN